VLFDGAVGLTTSVGDVNVDTCGMGPSGCPSGGSGTCTALTFGGNNGTYGLTVGAIMPLASGLFDCTSSEDVVVSLSQTNLQNEIVFGGIAGRSGTEVFGSCTISNETLDGTHWSGQITATLEDRLHGATATLTLLGRMHAR